MPKFTINSQQAKQNAINLITAIDVGKKPIMDVSIVPFKKDRTLPQNRYYFGVVLKHICEYTGFTALECHDLFKDSFLPKKTVTIGSKRIERTPSTTELSTIEFNSFIDDVTRYVAEELGLYIPLPNERF